MLGIFALLLAQAAPQPQNAELVRAARNPYDLARFIDSHLGFDWEVLWKALGTQGNFIQPCGKLSDGKRQCSTELITVFDPDQEILLVQGDATPADIYIRFLKDQNGGWKFSGVQSAQIHNHPRRHEVDRSTGTPFLRVSGQGVRGSGIDSEIESWYYLTQPEFEPVFSFTVQGYQNRMGFGISHNVSAYFSAGKESIGVTLQVKFSGEDANGELDLGTHFYGAVYTRMGAAKSFSLSRVDPKSKILPEDFVALADFDDGLSNEDLVRYDMAGLTEIASGKDHRARTWLRRVLTQVHDTREVLKLKDLLR